MQGSTRFAKFEEVQFVHPITKAVCRSLVYDTCYEGDPSTHTVQVKISEGCLAWKRAQDVQAYREPTK
jgi:hypothetical protein